MPAAFTFNPDGRAETVRQIWTLATSVLGIDKSRIWVSYFKGGKVLGDYLLRDEATRQAWSEVGVPERKRWTHTLWSTDCLPGEQVGSAVPLNHCDTVGEGIDIRGRGIPRIIGGLETEASELSKTETEKKR